MPLWLLLSAVAVTKDLNSDRVPTRIRSELPFWCVTSPHVAKRCIRKACRLSAYIIRTQPPTSFLRSFRIHSTSDTDEHLNDEHDLSAMNDSVSLSRATSLSRGSSKNGSAVSRQQSLIKKNIAPHDLRPSDILIERFTTWKAIVKQLIAYFEVRTRPGGLANFSKPLRRGLQTSKTTSHAR